VNPVAPNGSAVTTLVGGKARNRAASPTLGKWLFVGALQTIVDNDTTVNYRIHMIEVRQTTRFATWLAGLRDERARARILKRLDRAKGGNLGDVGPVGEGLSEMRIFYGPGYRVYFLQRGSELIVLLCGGNKSTQPADIEEAKALAKEIE
jgi:putative addiction module killer protein